MPDLFNTFSLLGQYRQDYTTRELRSAAAMVGNGRAFHRILLNDEQMRELTDTHRNGLNFDRERLSALITKAQQLQSRLQTIYRAMLERTLSVNSADEATPGQLTDGWASDEWRIAGADLPLNYSRAAMPDPDGSDRFARSSDDLGRLRFYRPAAPPTLYEERASYFTAVSYLYDWDLHQIRTTYATGSDAGAPLNDVSLDRRIDVVAVDPNRQPGRQWRAGDVIPLDMTEIFTPEFLASTIGQHLAGIRYQNGSGYQFDANVPLYAYVREVDFLPDGVTKPKFIDILAGPPAADADGDGSPDNVVWMDDYLRGVSSQTADLTLRDDAGMTTADVNGWLPDAGQVYHFSDAPFGGPNGGTGFDHSVWAGTHWMGSGAFGGTGFGSGQWDDDRAGFTKTIAMPDTPLMHPSLSYQLPWTVRIDDYGSLTWSSGSGWQTLAADGVGGPAVDANPPLTIDSMGLAPGALQFRMEGYNRKAQFWATLLPPMGGIAMEMPDGSWTNPNLTATWWRDGAAGLQIDNGALTLRTLRAESAPGRNDGDQNLVGAARFYVDPKGNIFDLFGAGNGSPDDYDYVPDVLTNQHVNLVGNVFGDRRHMASVQPLDSNGDGILGGSEAVPSLEISARSYNQPDIVIAPPTPGSHAPYGSTTADPSTQSLYAYNPGLAGIYLGFAEKADLTVGMAGIDKDAYGRSLNRLTIQPFRTGDSIETPTGGNAMLDRSYQTIPAGSTVVIRDGQGRIVDQQATIGPQAADGSYTVTPSAGLRLKSGTAYTVTLPNDPTARSGGSRENSLTHVLADILTTSEYRDVMKAGLLDDVMLTASATDAYDGILSGRLTIRWNRRQERMEIYQNSFAAIYKSAPPPHA
jgi:hypothetical protein